MEHNLSTLFDAIATRVPDRPAIVSSGATLSFAALASRARRFAHVLRTHGLGHHAPRTELEPWEAGQDLVGLYLLNGPEYLEATLGAYAARVAPANVNYRYVAEELAYLLNDAGAGAVVYHARFAPTLVDVLPRLTRTPLLLQVADDSGEALLPGALDYEAALASASEAVDAAPSPDDLYVLYTGGTTGMPKGTLWRQGDIYLGALGGDAHPDDADAAAIAAIAAAHTPEVLMPLAPFMHGAAHWVGLRGLLLGDTVVIGGVVDRLDPVDIWSTVEREGVERMLMVGEAFARPLLEELERATYDVSSVKTIVVGGAATSPETKERMQRLLPNTIVADTAGSSETGGALMAVASGGKGGEAAIFKPQPSVAVLDADKTRVLEPGHEGIGWFAKSGRIPLGYLGDKDKTAATFPTVAGKRWSVPGDRARMRDDGLVELLGRESVTINSGGEKIFAEEVEAAILRHPDVVDVIVVGRPSERWGQEVVAVASFRGDATDDDVLAVTAERVARYKLPKQIVRVDTVLRSPAGKADYGWAREIAGASDA